MRALVLSGALLCVVCALPAGCASTIDVGNDTDAASSSFSAPDGGGAAPPEASAPVGLCASSECPEGRVSCPNNPFPCAVDLTSDDDNCGSCGVRCPTDEAFIGRFSGAMHCVGGTCRLGCDADHADCNGILDDGCETVISGFAAFDINNCGGCGIVCTDVCLYGRCGCFGGGTFCPDEQCHVLAKENDNCGACGNVCPADTGQPIPAELNAERTCRAGECNRLGCASGYADCNVDLGKPGMGDGCETPTRWDASNCGGCGNVCDPGEQCVYGECMCPCGAVCFKGINTDPFNCGTCGFKCPGDWSSLESSAALGLDPAHGRPICDQGVCGYTCSPHWGDCDGDVENGCETDFLEDPLNCGGCGVRCDGVEGQACIDGRCLMKGCEVQ